MPSPCICLNGWNPECKRHGTARRARATVHKRRLWANQAETMAETQRIYRHNKPAQLRGSTRLDVMADRPEDWKDQAACRGKDTSLWFIDRGDPGEQAKAICASCPVRNDCLEYALTVKERYGIWGGMGQRERTEYAQFRERFLA